MDEKKTIGSPATDLDDHDFVLVEIENSNLLPEKTPEDLNDFFDVGSSNSILSELVDVSVDSGGSSSPAGSQDADGVVTKKVHRNYQPGFFIGVESADDAPEKLKENIHRVSVSHHSKQGFKTFTAARDIAQGEIVSLAPGTHFSDEEVQALQKYSIEISKETSRLVKTFSYSLPAPEYLEKYYKFAAEINIKNMATANLAIRKKTLRNKKMGFLTASQAIQSGELTGFFYGSAILAKLDYEKNQKPCLFDKDGSIIDPEKYIYTAINLKISLSNEAQENKPIFLFLPVDIEAIKACLFNIGQNILLDSPHPDNKKIEIKQDQLLNSLSNHSWIKATAEKNHLKDYQIKFLWRLQIILQHTEIQYFGDKNKKAEYEKIKNLQKSLELLKDTPESVHNIFRDNVLGNARQKLEQEQDKNSDFYKAIRSACEQYTRGKEIAAQFKSPQNSRK